MDPSFISWLLSVSLPVRFAVLWFLLASGLISLNSKDPPLSFPTALPCVLHVRENSDTRTAVYNSVTEKRGECDPFSRIQYTRDQLLSYNRQVNLTSSVVQRLRELQIGFNLPRKRTRRGGRRKCSRTEVVTFASSRSDRIKCDRDVSTVNCHNLINPVSTPTPQPHSQQSVTTTTRTALSGLSSPPRQPQPTPSFLLAPPLLSSPLESATSSPPGLFSTLLLPTTPGSPLPSSANLCQPDSPSSTLNSPPSSDEFTVCLFNAQSVCPDQKTDLIADYIFEKNFDLVFLTETWLKSEGHEPKIKQLTPPGYKLRSFPRPSRGGGIAVIYKDVLESSLSFTQNFPFPHLSFEAIEVVLNTSGQSVIFSCLYRPPPSRKNKLTSSMFHDEIQSLLEYYNLQPGKLLLLGDINFHFDNQNSSDIKRLCLSLTNHSLSQLVTEPTHRSGHIIDWLIARDSDQLVASVSVTEELSSDHFAVLSSLNLSKPKRINRSVTRRKLSSINPQTFSSEAAKRLSENTNSTDPAAHYNTVLSQLLDEHAPPTICLLPDRPFAPWYTQHILDAKRARRRTERRWRSTKLVVHRQIFQQERKKVSLMISTARTHYFSSQVLQSTSTKNLYSIMTNLLGTTKATPLPSTHSPSELPTIFSSFFSDKVQDLRNKLDQTSFQTPPSDPLFTGVPLLSFRLVSETEISAILKEMSLKSCELDPIPASIFSQCLPQLLPFITDIVNNSLLSGIFPSAFKTAIIRPLLKKHNLDPNILNNYRPVSNLSFISKLLEKVVLKQLNNHLLSNNLLHPFQSAYRANHSTETALVHIVNELLLASDSGKVSLLTLLDLSAAFDTIDHSILLTRLENTFGIQNSVLSWFKSYLNDRFQSVLVNNIQSEPVKLAFGVPQGSVLGPVLFTLYTAPLANIINQHNVKHHFYADDSQLQSSESPENISSLLSTTSDCFSDIQNWMTQNKLQLNGNKTEAMLVGTKQRLCSITIDSIQLGEHSVPLSESVKNLGVTLDSTLSMQKFIAQTCQSCYCQLRRISAVRKYLSTEATSTLVTSLILSRLDYCNALLSGLPASSIQCLQRIQNSAARLVLRKKKTDHITPLLHSLHWLPVSQRIKYKIDTLCYKCIYNIAPSYLCDCLHLYTPSRSLRSASDTFCLRIPRFKYSTVGCRSFSVSGPSTWNNLPLCLRQTPNLDTFKSNLKTHLFPHQ